MLTISGLKNFYYLPHFHDMRCGYSRILEIIRMSYYRNPYKGDVFFLYVHRKFYREQLERSDEDQPYPPVSCDDMSDFEKNSFIQYLI